MGSAAQGAPARLPSAPADELAPISHAPSVPGAPSLRSVVTVSAVMGAPHLRVPPIVLRV